MRRTIQDAIANKRKSVMLAHKGNIMKLTEGGFNIWGFELAYREFCGVEIDGGPWLKLRETYGSGGNVITFVIADALLQKILLRPVE